ncbi:glycosyltransferase family 2 protein [Dyella flagellata]|uniref:Glycosyl transferase n=1 Tax=Dyella flagellata TaxID=1867833 RepID=A0ABQ5XDA7_9GAMM|nr:glycosyltransferase family 2 protein [Dyella flagellata]GLQ88530.1 glycosyl transferase [Dyella flagellata]
MTSIPDISVITVVYNGAHSIEKCLQSVADQEKVAYEHIVIDGGSTDGTVDILKRHADKLAYWCSEKDAGIADAMNKGILHAKGNWIIFIHADDGLVSPDVLAKALAKMPLKVDIVAFPVLFGSLGNLRLHPPRPAGFWTRFKLGMCHQGMFVRRALFQRIGVFDTGFGICMDYEHVLRAVSAGASVRVFAEPAVAWMDDAGISSRRDWPSLRTRFLEEKRAQHLHVTSLPMRCLYFFYWSAYLPYRKIRSMLKDKRAG